MVKDYFCYATSHPQLLFSTKTSSTKLSSSYTDSKILHNTIHVSFIVGSEYLPSDISLLSYVTS